MFYLHLSPRFCSTFAPGSLQDAPDLSGQPQSGPLPLTHTLSGPAASSWRAAMVHCSCIACSGGTHAMFPQCITEACPALETSHPGLVRGHCWVPGTAIQERGGRSAHTAGSTASSAHPEEQGFAPERDGRGISQRVRLSEPFTGLWWPGWRF